ncbi:MAG: glycosyltransferase family 2 protein [Candidatus Poribacteria bacterium]|nr:glycosyltransferase family 2 protein [Candidatus Poribacteria bacterium]
MPSEKISVIIPVLNEENAIANVIADIPTTVRSLDGKTEATVQEIIVVDNGCTDNTATIAHRNGARVIAEPRRGYGFACLAGIAALTTTEPDIVVFLDGDYSDYPTDMPQLLHPILEGKTDFVIGARRADRARNALLPQARFGNWLACFLIKHFYGVRYTDLGPFRAIRYPQLLALNMQDKTFGWTVEMQLKAAKQGIPVCEVPVRYRKRIGVSKITGTFTGTLKAGYKILTTLIYHRFLT